MEERFRFVLGRLLAGAAVVLERVFAGRRARKRWLARRNAAVRGAYRRGVPVDVLAARLGWSPGWVRQVLNGKAEPEVEEAA